VKRKPPIYENGELKIKKKIRPPRDNERVRQWCAENKEYKKRK